MGRQRADAVFGTITNNPLAIGDTTLNSANLAGLPAIASPDYLAITLDPLEVSGAAEIVYVTAHTAAATSATILRGQEGTTARQHATATPWTHTITAQDFLVEAETNPLLIGPPTAGTWKVGAQYQDGQGVRWTCIQAGAPGLWQCDAPQSIIARYEVADTLGTNATTPATSLEIASIVVPSNGINEQIFSVQGRPLSFNTGQQAVLALYDTSPGGVTAPANSNLVCYVASPAVPTGGVAAAGGYGIGSYAERRRVADPADRWYSLRLYGGAAGCMIQQTTQADIAVAEARWAG